MSVDAAPPPPPQPNGHPTYPEIKSIHRLASVPIVHDSISSLDALLSHYSTTNTLKIWAQAWGEKAYKLGEPYGARLAGVIGSADDIANQGLDVLQRRFPYPFIAPTEEIISKVRAPADHAYTAAATYVGAGQKAVNEKIVAPALGAAEEVDKSLSPYLDSLEARVRPYVPPRDAANGAEDHSKPTHVRAFELTLDARARAATLTQEQLAHLQEHSVLLQRASGALAVLSTAAREQTQAALNTLLRTLDALQGATARLPAEVQHQLEPFSAPLKETYEHVLAVSKEDTPLPEKSKKLASAAQQGLGEVLTLARGKVAELLRWGQAEVGKTVDSVNGKVKGEGNGVQKVGEAVEARVEQVGEAAKVEAGETFN